MASDELLFDWLSLDSDSGVLAVNKPVPLTGGPYIITVMVTDTGVTPIYRKHKLIY